MLILEYCMYYSIVLYAPYGLISLFQRLVGHHLLLWHEYLCLHHYANPHDHVHCSRCHFIYHAHEGSRPSLIRTGTSIKAGQASVCLIARAVGLSASSYSSFSWHVYRRLGAGWLSVMWCVIKRDAGACSGC